MNPKRWVGTLPTTNNIELNQEKYNLDPNRWVGTLPRTSTNNSIKKYSFTIMLFVIGLIFVSIIKNETRNLQREINGLQTSINTLRYDIHQTTLDHEFITSPENISRLAKEYLESNLVPYKKSQIKQLNKKKTNSVKLQKTKHEENFMKKNKKFSSLVKLQITKKIDEKKTELRKFQELYSTPEKLPDAIKIKVATAIETKKNELKKLYSSPKDSIDLAKTQRWAAFQVVKVFLGIPLVPGK